MLNMKVVHHRRRKQPVAVIKEGSYSPNTTSLHFVNHLHLYLRPTSFGVRSSMTWHACQMPSGGCIAGHAAVKDRTIGKTREASGLDFGTNVERAG